MDANVVLPTVFFWRVLQGLSVAGAGALIVWPFRKARKEWMTLKESTQAIRDELAQQRTNCLATLQNQGESQIQLLTKMSDTLQNIHLSQAEMTGYFARPKTRRTTKK
jgi:hypothetical protein